MKYYFKTILYTISSWLLLSSCETVAVKHSVSKHKARVTYYCASEDRRWKNKRADGGRIQPCRTAAMSKDIPFGSVVKIPALKPVIGCDQFTVQDRGGVVESRKASHGLLPIVDVAVESKKMIKWLAAVMPPVLDIE